MCITKKNIVCTILFILSCFITPSMYGQKEYSVISPNKNLTIKINIGEKIYYSISHCDDEIIAKSQLAIELENNKIWGVNSKLKKSKQISINQSINASVYKKNKIEDCYNEIAFDFKEGFSLVFRAYDDGAAYRFVYNQKEPLIVRNEIAQFNLPTDQKVYLSYTKPRKKDGSIEAEFYSAFQNTYEYINVSQWDTKKLSYSPILIESANGKKACLLEADLMNYPGMFFGNFTGTKSIHGVFSTYPKSEQIAVRGLSGEVTERESYIAKLEGKSNMPWRVIVVSSNDYELANNDMVYKLATPANEDVDYSWIKPGKVAWDWWNNWNLYGVDFETGINNETYKYYIDFASKRGIEYVILDEGWSKPDIADLYQVVPEIDLKGIIEYANKKNVGIILWAGYYGFNKDIEGICKHYAAMGVKGFKLDFMDRDDQKMVEFHRDAAEIASKYKLLINFHGTYKPTGLQRTYPNVVNFEGVHGLEEMKWADLKTDQVTYDVTIPYIRMVAGPLDYTQGAMRNAIKKNFRSVYTEPMSQGTRCRQLALYVILEAPLNMLCDSPTNYEKEEECTDFITSVPTVWDETIALNGKVGEYISMARRKGDLWYVASLTNWDKRELELDLSFLADANYKVEIFKDGINADKVASDYKRVETTLPSSKKLKILMSEGGGYVAKITKI